MLQFLEVTALGTELAWRIMKLWMKNAGRTLNNYQWRVVANAMDSCTLPIFTKLVFQEVTQLAVVFSLMILLAGLPVEELHGAREDGVDDQRAGLSIPGTTV